VRITLGRAIVAPAAVGVVLRAVWDERIVRR